MEFIKTCLRAAGLGILGFMAPRLLVAAGIPLDVWAQIAGQYFGRLAVGQGFAMTQDAAITIIGIILGLSLITVELWIHPAKRLIGWLKATMTHGSREPTPTIRLSKAIAIIFSERKDTNDRTDIGKEILEKAADGNLIIWGSRYDELMLSQDDVPQKIRIKKNYWRHHGLTGYAYFAAAEDGSVNAETQRAEGWMYKADEIYTNLHVNERQLRSIFRRK
jgi:hypothetical protein